MDFEFRLTRSGKPGKLAQYLYYVEPPSSLSNSIFYVVVTLISKTRDSRKFFNEDIVTTNTSLDNFNKYYIMTIAYDQYDN